MQMHQSTSWRRLRLWAKRKRNKVKPRSGTTSNGLIPPTLMRKKMGLTTASTPLTASKSTRNWRSSKRNLRRTPKLFHLSSVPPSISETWPSPCSTIPKWPSNWFGLITTKIMLDQNITQKLMHPVWISEESGQNPLENMQNSGQRQSKEMKMLTHPLKKWWWVSAPTTWIR